MIKQKYSPRYKQVEGYKHVGLDEEGVPHLQGTATKVVEIVIEYMEYKWGIEQLHIQHPHLSRAQICSALAYYWDHKDGLDADIDRRRLFVEKTRKMAGPSPL